MENNENKEQPRTRIAKSSFSYMPNVYTKSIWSPEEVDKFDGTELKEYKTVVKQSRFFYKKDPIASTVVNKIIEIGINDLIFDKGNLSDNEYRIFLGIKDNLLEFSESMAMEYLISGLVVPEYSMVAISTDKVKELGIKKKQTIIIPERMWLRDPETIKIKFSWALNQPSYFAVVPPELVSFILNKGSFSDGTKDIELYEELLKLYPDFVQKIRDGQREFLLDNSLIIRRKPLSNSPYPIPYLYPALESLGHKRNLRRMDYSVASRVITAIMQVKIGDKDFPLTEDDEQRLEEVRRQMLWRGSVKDIERIFQLFTDHTVEIKWVFPDVTALLSDKKYADINQDIFFSLGFPRILTTGETERTGSSDPEFASISPVKSMENMRNKILKVIKGIIKDVAESNRLSDIPKVRFGEINLHSFATFVEGMVKLYETANISRTSFAGQFGYTWEEEVKQKALENDLMKKLGVEEFAPVSFSPQPQGGNNNQNPETNPENKPKDGG